MGLQCRSRCIGRRSDSGDSRHSIRQLRQYVSRYFSAVCELLTIRVSPIDAGLFKAAFTSAQDTNRPLLASGPDDAAEPVPEVEAAVEKKEEETKVEA